jgi:DNA polymerase III subunit gamma/tau
VVGQQHVTKTLKNALSKDNLAHAFLFCGPRGVGKTTCARILAKVINCEGDKSDMEPCNVCDSCVSFQLNSSFNIIELDAASHNSVEHMKALVDQVRFQPQKGTYKVFIIDEVHMLSSSAFNAFLKTLEEPPSYAIFILATTEKHKIIPTILSRCQIYDFKRIGPEDIVAHLTDISVKEGIYAEPDALHIIAQKSDGGLRDALSMFDRLVAFSANELTYKIAVENLNVLDYDYFFRAMDAMLSEDVQGLIRLFDEVLQRGFEGDHFMNGLSSHFRDLLMAKDSAALYLLDVGDDLKKRYVEQASIVPESFILSAIEIANECDLNFKNARNRRLHVELALIKMTFIHRASYPQEKKNNPPDVVVPEKKEPAIKSTISKREEVIVPIKKSLTEIERTQPPITKIPSHAELLATIREKELSERSEAMVDYTIENVYQIWNEWLDSIPQESIKSLLSGVKIGINGVGIEMTVSSALAEGALKTQTELMDLFRKKFSNRELILNIKVEKSEFVEKQKFSKPQTNKEKFQAMVASNPLVELLQKNLDLTFDDEY